MKKRLIAVMALISGFCLSLGLTACTVDGRNDRFVFEPNENGYTLTDYIGAETQADIPAEHDGKPVTEIGDRAFSDRANLKEVAIPDSVTKIGANAFDGCHDLEKIVVAEENPRYGSQDGILYNKDKTEFLQIPEAIGGAVTIPDSIQKIGDEAFHSRKLLTDITISAGVTEIGQDAFGDCAGLASIRVGKGNPIYHSDGNCLIETTTGTLLFGCKTSAIPDDGSVTKIGRYAFEGCSGLTEITIPDSVTEIGRDAFCNCSGLTKVHVSDLAAWCGIEFEALTSTSNPLTFANPLLYAGHLYLDGEEITELTIPSGVTKIGRYAFEGCSGLTEITIPDSVTEIGRYAFYWDSGLREIIIGSGVTRIGRNAFYDCKRLKKVHISDLAAWCGIEFETLSDFAPTTFSNPLLYAGHLYMGEEEVTTLKIPSGVTKIGRYAFEGCLGLTEVTIPGSVTETGNSAFYECAGLREVAIGSGMTAIGERAFWQCNGLEKIAVEEENLRYSSQDGILYNKEKTQFVLIPKALKGAIAIPDSVTEIGERAFAERTGLTQVTLGSEVIGRQAFYGCTKLAQVTLGDGVAKIGDNTFDGCSALESITVEGENAHYSSQDGILYDKEKTQFVLIPKALKGAIAIPDSVTEIGERAFAERTRLTQVTIDSEVIGRQAFDGCTGLVQIALGDGVTEIGEMAFRDCTGLTQVTIDSEVIGRQAFYGCTGLAQIMLGDGVTEIGQDAFALCTGITSIRVERGNPVYHSNGNCLIETDAKVLLLGCNASDIPDDGSVTEIGHDAFAYCTGLTEIAIPDSVEKIQDEAFVYCTGLTKATIGSGVTEIGGSAFKDCWRLVEVWNRSELRIETNSYGLDAFKVYLTDEASKQGQTADGYLFYEDGEISCLIGYVGNETELILPANSPNGRSYEIYQHALHGDTSLKEIAIPDNVTKIGALAFGDCTKLIRITIGKSVTEIGKSAFENCSAMEKIIVGEENAQYSSQDGILYDKEKTQFVLIPQALKGTVAIPDSVTEIGERAFADRTGLTQVAIGSGVAKIGDSAFDGCSALESITVKGENAHYSSQDGILYNKAKTEFIHVPKAIKGAVTIPDSMKKIEGKAFSGCEGLTQVTIGSGVSRIESGAFEGCSNLQRVIFQKTSGWVCFDGETDVRILPTDLEDGETAALYLKFTYSDALWRRAD